MPEPLLYLKAMAIVVVVSVASVLTMLVVWRFVSKTWLNSVSVLGMGIGLTVGYYVMAFRLVWPPVNGLDRFLTIVLPVTLGIELIAGFSNLPNWVAWILRISLAVMIPRILLHGSVYLSGNDWTLWQAATTMLACTLLLAVVWSLLFWLSQRSPGVSISLALYLATLCMGLIVMMGGYIRGGAAAFPLAGVLLASPIWIRWITTNYGRLDYSGDSAVLGIGVVGLFGLLLVGVFFGRVSMICGLATLLAPLICWSTEPPLLRHRKPWVVGSIRLVLVAIPLLLVITAAKHNFDRDMAPLLGKVKVSTLRELTTPTSLYRSE